MANNYVTLTGNLGTGAARAMAIFTPSGWLADATNNLLLPPSPVTAILDSTGKFSVSLLATDNGAPQPSGWTWTVEFVGIQAVDEYTFSFFLPFSGGATQDISDLAPVQAAAAMAAYMPLPSGTPTAGQVPVATGSGQASAWRAVSGQFLCAPAAYAPSTQTLLTTTSATMVAVSSANVNTGSFVAPPSGSVIVTATAIVQTSSSGSQFAFGLCAHGTTSPMVGFDIVFKAPTTTQPFPYSLVFPVSGLTPGTSYNFDLMFAIAGASTLTVYAFNQTATTPNLANSGTGAPVVMTVQAV
jgi:hypothetical protein